MRFWDSSAVVPLLLEQLASAQLREIASSDDGLAVWWATRIECLSAMARLIRAGQLPEIAGAQARATLRVLMGDWTEVIPSDGVRGSCERLLAVHPLSAADAFQLSAALIWARGSSSGKAFVCLDRRLRDAAHREGFDILPEEPIEI